MYKYGNIPCTKMYINNCLWYILIVSLTPAYTRNDLTDSLHEKFGFRTDYEILKESNLKKILRKTKK